MSVGRPIFVGAVIVAFSVPLGSRSKSDAQDTVARALSLVPADARDHTTILSRTNEVMHQPSHGPKFSPGTPVKPASRRWQSADGADSMTIPAQRAKPGATASLLDVETTAAAPPGSANAPPGQVQANAPFAFDTGALHAVRSTNGYSAIHAAISIPCKAAVFSAEHGADTETGFAYLGGWGAGGGGLPTDAGLQKSSSQKPGAEDYAPYWKYYRNAPVTAWPRFDCGGPDVVMEYYPLADDLLYFSARGHIEGTDSVVTVAIVQVTRPGEGWRNDGGNAHDGIILKRMITIAQSPSTSRLMPKFGNSLSGDGSFDYVKALPRLRNGSYFGLVDGKGPAVLRWSDCEIGRVDAQGHPHFQPWTRDKTFGGGATGGFYDLPPPNPYSRGVTSAWSGNCDAAAIDLRQPPAH